MMIIGIDHGYGFIKTKNISFLQGIAKLSTQPPINKNIIKYNDCYYQVGVEADGISQDKTVNEDYYIATLAAIAEELKRHNVHKVDIKLAAGLPLTRYGTEKDAFAKYLTQNNNVEFTYEDVDYHIYISDDIYIYPQGYSAIASRLGNVVGSSFLIDIGTSTTEILAISGDHRIDLNKARSVAWGTSECIARVNEEISRVYSTTLSVDQILDVMIGRKHALPQKIVTIIEAQIKEFCHATLNILRQNKVNYEITQSFFMGGGSLLLNRYSDELKACDTITYIKDIRANAAGYELLAVQSEKMKHKK